LSEPGVVATGLPFRIENARNLELFSTSVKDTLPFEIIGRFN
jgi:hypothetical protein